MRIARWVKLSSLLLVSVAIAGCLSEPEDPAPLAEFDSTVVRRAPGRYQLMTPLPNSAGRILYTLFVPTSVNTSGTRVSATKPPITRSNAAPSGLFGAPNVVG